MLKGRALQILLALIDGAQIETIINENMRAEGVPVIQHGELDAFERTMRDLIEQHAE